MFFVVAVDRLAAFLADDESWRVIEPASSPRVIIGIAKRDLDAQHPVTAGRLVNG